MDKNGAIIISNWQSGIGDSPYTGFADVRNCEIHYPEGVLKIALAPKTLLTSGGANPVVGLPTWMANDYSGNFYAGGYLDANIYQFTGEVISKPTYTGTTFAFGTGGGIFYKGNLIATAMATGTGAATLIGLKSNQFYTLGTLDSANIGDVTPFWWAQDDSVYIGIQKYVDKFTASDTFDPSNSGTYTTPLLKQLDIFNYYKIDTISEIGVNLYFGASKRGNVVDILQESFEGRIFPWNTTDPSFKLPIILDKGGVYQMISRNGAVTFANGHKGNFITTNGSLTQDLPEIGLIKNNKPNIFFQMLPEAKDFINGEYLFGVSTADTTSTPAGIYGFKNGVWRFLEIATGNTGTTGTVSIGVIKKRSDTNFYVGWQDGSNYGVDEFGANGYYYTGYRARVDTTLYKCGSVIHPHQFNKVDITLGKPLTIGQGIRLSYCNNLSDTFIVMGTYDYATYGAVDSFQDAAQMLPVNNVQFRIELTTGFNSTTTPELVSIRISTNS